jgi:hypothetical protein
VRFGYLNYTMRLSLSRAHPGDHGARCSPTAEHRPPCPLSTPAEPRAPGAHLRRDADRSRPGEHYPMRLSSSRTHPGDHGARCSPTAEHRPPCPPDPATHPYKNYVFEYLLYFVKKKLAFVNILRYFCSGF